MKANSKSDKLILCYLLMIFVFMANIALAQEDTGENTSKDDKENVTEEKKEKKKKKDSFKVFGGVNFNQLKINSEHYDPSLAAGWQLGASYKRGNFFYWGIGGTYNDAIYNLLDTASLPGAILDGVFSVRSIDVPLTVGLDFLSFISRIVGLRLFVSAVPSFVIGVGDNKLGISTDNVNKFLFNGQIGLGVDVAFIFVEAGYGYGFVDVFKNDIKSTPSQIFINLGFRF